MEQKANRLTNCARNLANLKKEVEAGSPMDRKMSQCKSTIEQVRMQVNKQALTSAGVNPGAIKCFSHSSVCITVKDGKVCRPTTRVFHSVSSWHIERAVGHCYDKYDKNKPSASLSIGSHGRTPPQTDEQKASALKACKANLDGLKKYLVTPKRDRDMIRCKLSIEQVRIKRNKQNLIDAGVNPDNINCFSHSIHCMDIQGGQQVCRPTVTSLRSVQSWYVEKAAGICYDVTAPQELRSSTSSIGSLGQTPPQTDAQKETILKNCQTNLARLQKEIAGRSRSSGSR